MHCPALDSCVLVCARLLYMYVSTTLVYVCVRDSRIRMCARLSCMFVRYPLLLLQTT